MVAFEERIAAEFNASKIRHPVHFENGNEDALIAIFKHVRPEDYVFVSWRGHLKALLKGVPPEDLAAAIRRGESMALRFPEQRVYGSAIVGGTIPIALGVAMAIKRAGGSEKVWCFLGDMTRYTGIFLESRNYAEAHELPVIFVVENNGVSVCTPTADVWPKSLPRCVNMVEYEYRSKWPHAGAGVRVQF